RNLPVNQTLVVKAGDTKDIYSYPVNPSKTIFTSTDVEKMHHSENLFNDFTVQRLLPNYLSRQGPSLAIGDVNKDGLNDVFLGAAKGSVSKLFLQKADGSFNEFSKNTFTTDSSGEVTASTFFDADGDGDPDLYVAYGGFEFNENDPSFQDKLFMNDGKGSFTEKKLPSLLFSKGCVKSADIDGDGDLDLFVGGRLIPGKYPLAAPSKILLNDGKGNFTDVTKTIAPSFDTLGMVTDAVWIDINHDKKKDLVVVGEWMPIKFFLNTEGKLKDASADFIHFASTGWWNRITASDIDNDGDEDLVIGNAGTNTQFHATEKEPVSITYKDFDNNNSIDPILQYYVEDTLFPALSRDDLAEQLPFIKKNFLTYKSYSTATMADIFTREQLTGSNTLSAALMETVYLENKGTEFILHHLPAEAQYSPVYGIVVADFDGDKKKDILLTGNNTWTRVKFGRYSANHGVLLSGDDKGNFSYLPQTKSGLNVRSNVRSAVPLSDKKVLLGVNDGNVLQLSFNK
ncbi:MAG: VCBS repeat-containing protein, partial [Bacteroidota bacterium]